MRAAPHRDLGLVPNPGAAASAIDAAERRIGRALPPSYRAFLASHDGWPRFFEGATLLGTANLGLRLYADLARAAFEAAETPVPDVGPPVRPRQRALIAFGADLQGTTLFAFDAASPQANGELEVIAWINEIGLRRPTFPDFLELVEELCDAEIAELEAPATLRRAG
jgi:hypothetical protein